MTRSIPPTSDLFTLIRASQRNAAELLEDAKLLLAAGRAPRAHALATLALEEIGKSHVCIIATNILPILDGPIYGPNGEGFWKVWQSHPIKIFWAQTFLNMMVRGAEGPIEEVAERLADQSLADHLRKMRGLYVDYEDGGMIRLPSEVTEAEARQLVEDASIVVEINERSWGSEGAGGRMLEMLEDPTDLQRLAAQISEAYTADPEATFAAARRIFAGAFDEEASDQEAGEPEAQGGAV